MGSEFLDGLLMEEWANQSLARATERGEAMAKKNADTLSAEHKALAAQAGIDVNKIPWDKVLQLIQLLVSLFAAKSEQLTSTARAGCETHAEGCLTAAGQALDAAQTSLECARGMCETGEAA